MNPRRWAALATLTAAAAGVLAGSAVQSDRVLNDRTGYIRRDPALPSETPYVRRPLRPLPIPAPWENR